MKQSKRLLSVIIALCFMVGCFSPIPTFAQSTTVTTENQTTTNNEVIHKQDPQDIEVDKEVLEVDNTPYDLTTESDVGVTTTGSAIKTTPEQDIEVKDEDDSKNEESLWYRKQNPLKKEHQKLLWEYCQKRNLDFIDMLSLIYTESNFNEKCTTGKYYGYFQISSGNCSNLSATLKTKNKPLDGTININWGTAFYSWILEDKRVKDLEGKKKRDVALSIYQRGTGGYDKYGISKSFLKTFYKKREKVCGWYEGKNK